MVDTPVVYLAVVRKPDGSVVQCPYTDRTGNPTPLVAAILDGLAERGVNLADVGASLGRAILLDRGELIARQRIELDRYRQMFEVASQ